MVKSVLCFLLLVGNLIHLPGEEVDGSKAVSFIYGEQPRVLSRRKRYLIFPEGSSLQLVFCLTMPVIGHSTIFTIGDTLSLAWQLPDEPYDQFRRKKLEEEEEKEEKKKEDKKQEDKKAESRIDQISHQYIDKPWNKNYYTYASNKYKQSYYNKPYRDYNYKSQTQPQQFHQYGDNRRKGIYYEKPMYYDYNNAFKKQTPIETDSYVYKPNWNTKSQKFNSPWREDYNYQSMQYDKMHPEYNYVHRRTRRNLYEKLYELFAKHKSSDASCLLKAICEVSHSRGTGSFLEEIIKTVFQMNIEGHSDTEDFYDRAANSTHNCHTMYSNCKLTFIRT